jgi:hypothetical protein
MAQTNPDYFICETKDPQKTAKLIEHLDLSLEERFLLTASPAKVGGDRYTEKCMYDFAKALSKKQVCRISEHVKIPVIVEKGALQLRELESRHKVTLLYLWLRCVYCR